MAHDRIYRLVRAAPLCYHRRMSVGKSSSRFQILVRKVRSRVLLTSHRWSCDYYEWQYASERPERLDYLPPPAMWVMRPEFFWGWLLYRTWIASIRWRDHRARGAKPESFW